MEEATWLEGFDYGAGMINRGAGSTVVASEQVYIKYLSCVSDSDIRTGTITFYGDVDESQELEGLGSGATYQNGTMHIAVAAGTQVNGACVSGAANYNLDDHYATGGKKSVFKLEDDFLHYGPSANDYTAVAAMAQEEKILMNYVKTGYGTPYGGTGDSSLANTLYISNSHFHPFNTTLLAE